MSVEHYKEIGDYLRDCREGQGDDIDKVSKQLNIRSKYLKAIEEGKFDTLPGTIYTEGYLKNYAEYLNLDPKEVIKKYKYGTANDDEEQDEEEFALPEHSGDKFSPNPRLLVGSALAIIVLYTIWYQVTNHTPSGEAEVIERAIGDALSDEELTVLGVMTGRVGVEEVENKDALRGMDMDSEYSLAGGKSDSNQPQDTSILDKPKKSSPTQLEIDGEEILGWKTEPSAGE